MDNLLYYIQVTLSALTYIPFILMAIFDFMKWRKDKQLGQQSSSINFHFLLFVSCLLHSISFVLFPEPTNKLA